MAIPFSDVEASVRTDLSQDASSSITHDTIFRYCREVYHELLHTKSDLRAVFNQTTGVVTYLPDVLQDTDEQFPDALDDRKVAILAGVRARITKVYLTTAEQVARHKLDLQEFNEEQGLVQPR